jgi:hypothetical protein
MGSRERQGSRQLPTDRREFRRDRVQISRCRDVPQRGTEMNYRVLWMVSLTHQKGRIRL